MASLIDSLSKTMTTAQVYNYFNGDIELLIEHMIVCSMGNRLALMDLMSHKYKEKLELEREELVDKDIVNHLRGDS